MEKQKSCSGKREKVFFAVPVPLRIPEEHRGNNGCQQVATVIKCQTKKRFAELTGVGLRHLNGWCNLHEIRDGEIPRVPSFDRLEPEVVYYEPCCFPHIHDWFPLKPRGD